MSIGRPRPARRALVRWSWRLFRREWRQQLLVLALITVAVAAAIAAAAITVNGVSKANAQLGDANALIRVDAHDQPAAAARAVAAARQRFGEIEVIGHQQVIPPGLSQQLDLRAQDPSGHFGHRTLALRAGRYPTAAGEVALTDGAASMLSAGVGDHGSSPSPRPTFPPPTKATSDRQLLIYAGDGRTSPVPDLAADDVARLDARAAEIAATLGDAQLYHLDVAMTPGMSQSLGVHAPISVVRPIRDGFRGLGYACVATPELLAHFGIGSPGDAIELLTSRPGDVMLLDVDNPPARGAAPDTAGVQRADLPSYSSAPNSLVTEAAMRRHGWVPVRAGWLVETSRPLTPAQIAAARAAAADAGLHIEVRDRQDNLATLRTIATLVGALLALAIITMTIGLIRGESAADLRTLTATGAAPRTRRALTATTAAALAALGATLGTAGAYIALLAAYHSDLSALTPLPVADLAAIVVGLPVIAAGAGWILAGREPKGFARRALD